MAVGTTSPEARLSIRMFGPLDVFVGGKPLPRLRSRKGQHLLALLALHDGQTLDRRWLAGCLWPDAPESQAFASLRQSLADLRRALGCQADRIESPSATTLRLSVEVGMLDLSEFDRLISNNGTEALEQAVALYRGPLLEGCMEDWVVPDREARAQSFLSSLETLSMRLQHVDQERATGYLRRAVQMDPFRESAQRALMKSLTAAGRFAEATHVYRELQLYLRREMNTDPDPATTALYRQLCQETQQRLQQSTPPGSHSTPGFVPIPLTPLVGREREVEQILDLMKSARIITLTGTGGIGKTRLAVEAASLLATAMPEGAWFVDLAPTRDQALVPQTVATALDLHETAGTPLQKTLIDYIRNRALLLVLDNCEHLLDATATLVFAVLQSCATVKILATSREPMDVPGEVVLPIPPLDRPPIDCLSRLGQQPPAALLEYDAVRLLAARIQSQRPDFALTRENARFVVQICDRLDGIALAIELAAARAKTLPIQQIAARLDDCFHLLAGGSRTSIPRHQTLTASIDWSFELLDLPQQILLRRLAVFAGGWTLEAAEAVCGTDDVLDLLTQLVDKSLVVVEQGGNRFRLLETIRQYASARLLEVGEIGSLRERRQRYFSEMVHRDPPQIGIERIDWLARLSCEHENFRAILDDAQTSGPEAVIALRLATDLWRYCHERRRPSDGLRWLERALQDRSIGDSHLRAPSHNGAGVLCWDLGDAGRARGHLAISLGLYRDLGDEVGAAHALNNLGLVAWIQGDIAGARALHEECLELRRRSDPEMTAISLYNLGLVACDDLRFDDSRGYLAECLAEYQKSGHTRYVGFVIDRLGYIAFLTGDFALATQMCTESLAIFREHGDCLRVAISLNTLANLAVAAGDYGSARSMFTESLELRWASENPSGTVDSLNGFAYLAAMEGEARRAARLWGAAESLSVALNCPLSPPERLIRDRQMDTVRSAVGDRVFEVALASGRHLSRENAYCFALESTAPG